MKLKQLSAAIIATSALASGALAGDVTVYGKVNMSLNSTDLETKGTDQWDLNSNASRIGIKGSIDINDSLKAIYKAEYETDFTGDASSTAFKYRNIYGGVQGSFGTLVAGRNDTPVKMSEGKVDRFNDLILGDIKNVMHGESRLSSMIMYTTPSFSGLSVTAAVAPGEDDAGVAQGDNGIADAISASINYSNDMVTAAIAMDDSVRSDNNPAKTAYDIIRAVADFKFGNAKVGALYQEAEESNGNEKQTGYVVSGEFAINELILKAQYSGSEEDISDDKITQVAVGADYKLSKASMVYAYYAQISHDYKSAATEDDSTIAVGYEIKF